jgi:hypothetical protein
MRKLLNFLPLIGLFLLLTGCPYESEVPIDDPSVPVPGAIIGKWMKSGADKDFYLINKAESNTMIVEENTWSEDSQSFSKVKYYAHLSDIGGNQFMNLKKEGTSTYYIYKCELTGDKELKLIEVSNYVKEKFTSSQDLKKFIKKYMKLSFFYADESVYVKQ